MSLGTIREAGFVGIGSQWISVMGVLGWRMPDFESYPDPTNPHRHLIRRCEIGVDDFHTESQGIHLIQRTLFHGVLGVMDDLPRNHASGMALDGTFSIAKAYLGGCKEALEASYIGHFIVREAGSGAELVDVEWTWTKGKHIYVNSVTLANDEGRLTQYFNGLKFNTVKQLELALAEWFQQMPRFAEEMLWAAGYIMEEPPKPTLAPIAHVETEWDVLS